MTCDWRIDYELYVLDMLAQLEEEAARSDATALDVEPAQRVARAA